jgi:FADH2 O2-dependent halogenase
MTDIAIVGSGFGGSILAMIARRLGYRVVLLERGRHPRFAIGESASPLAGVLIEQLADRYDLPRLRPLSAFGTWQRTYPDVVCGLKRGFTYFKHEVGQRYSVAADRSNRLLVAASPNDELSDTHWLRSDVDHFLLREAIALGAEYLDEVTLERVEWEGHDAVLTGQRRGAPVRVRARFVIDASGPRGFLSRAMGIAERGFDGYPQTQALYSHFVDVPRCDQMPDFDGGQ